ncbi:MAG: DNA and RNA helicase [Bacillota bacterium]|jgi:hypothetical protein
MFSYSAPCFSKGSILKKEMLENLRDFPRNFAQIFFKNYSDGIIAGTDLEVGQGQITVTKGIIKYGDRLFMLESDRQVPYYNTNREIVIKVKFTDEAVNRDFIYQNAEILLDENTTVDAGEMELGRFKLREGAVLRSDYSDFYDFATEYNTINIINTRYAAPWQSTMNPKVLQYFARVVLQSATENFYDISFAMQCMNQEIVHRKLIIHYLAGRLGIEAKDYTNMELYKYLALIVKESGSGIKRRVELRQKGPARIIVD